MALKDAFSDRTHWRNMLKSATPDAAALLDSKDEALDALGAAYEPFSTKRASAHPRVPRAAPS